MAKKVLTLVAAAAACLAAAALAAAYVTPPANTAGVHSLITCLYHGTNPPPPGVIGGTGDSKGSISASTDLWLTIGWGANTQAQLGNFLAAEYGSVVISQYDETTKTVGSTVDSISWGNPTLKKQTDVSLWTAPAAVNDPRLNSGRPFWQSRFYWNVGLLPSGSYWVAPDFELTKTTFDGTSNVPAGPWDNTGCELVVS